MAKKEESRGVEKFHFARAPFAVKKDRLDELKRECASGGHGIHVSGGADVGDSYLVRLLDSGAPGSEAEMARLRSKYGSEDFSEAPPTTISRLR